MKQKTKDKLTMILIYVSVFICLLSLINIIMFVFKNGLAYLNIDFLIKSYNPLSSDSGILPMIAGTIYIVILTLVIAIPISIGSAIYLNEYAKENIVTNILRFSINGLASVPSIVYGLFGFSLFVVTLKEYTNGYSILSGSFTLSIMILPILIKTIEEALKMLPNELREASLSLGVSKIETIFKIVIVSSISNIINAIILAIGRIISESAPLILSAGMVYLLPDSIFDSTRTLTTHLYYLISEGISINAQQEAYATASVLILLVISLNILIKVIEARIIRRTGK